MKFSPQPFDPSRPVAGIYTMPVSVYHADCAPEPSHSSGSLVRTLDQSPAHAAYYHPRIGGHHDDSGRKTDIGSAVHRLVLDAGQEIAVIEADSFRSKAAQEARGAAEAEGRIPILADDYAVAKALAEPLREATETYLGAKIADCLREFVITWSDENGWHRALIDIATADLRKAMDLKTTRGSGAPSSCVQRIFDAGYDVQSAHYMAGMDSLDPAGRGKRTFGFIFGETDAPHAISPPIELSEGAQTVARERRNIAAALFASCLRANVWPGYDQETLVTECPPYMLSRWQQRMETDRTLNPVQS